jgi:valyl-tRNA synthetase
VGRLFGEPSLYEQVFPFALRPQAHEIIRTWAFYTIVKSHYHFDRLPWSSVAISGWGLAPEGSGKISKSRGGGPVSPDAMLDRYSADALRYWAASTSFGKDSVIDEEKIQAGAKLVTKLWNVARFSEHFLRDYVPVEGLPASLTPADRWLLSRTQRLVARVSERFRAYDYASAKSDIEVYFWTELADNYLEMAKKRLYDGGAEAEGARFTLYVALLTTLKLLAPLLPYVTEAIYRGMFNSQASLHRAPWPTPDATLTSDTAEHVGEALVAIATAVRRFKSDHELSLGAEVNHLQLATHDPQLKEQLLAAEADLGSITRAKQITVLLVEDAQMAGGDRRPEVAVALTV